MIREVTGALLDVIGCALSLVWTVLVLLFSEPPYDDEDLWW